MHSPGRPVKDQQITRLKLHLFDCGEIVGFAVRKEDTAGQQVGQHGMEFDRTLPGSELGPRKDTGAEIDGGGINDLDLWINLLMTGHVGIYPLQQLLIGLFENHGRAVFFSFCQGGTLNRR